ncbi:MAG: polyphosphate polymerase domain-containing protein [Bacilli bacterium]|nr:polyphosphate polymerase domain-containing protein [Bacilli bacterium]MBN2877607.1 polyphosphate polymerase domain-containing protein [Bacilli bacterium]
MEERIELKFLIHLADYHHLRRQLELFMQQDEYATHDNGYHLQSLYFDDMYDSATYDKADGIEYHKKFRIRSFENGTKRLEYKVKNGNLTQKETMFLEDELEQSLIQSDTQVMESHLEEPLIKTLFLGMKLNHLEPKLYIDYFREIYTFANNEIRITFDQNLEVRSFENPKQIYKLLEQNQIIMEVKYRSYFPTAIKKIVLVKNYQPIPYSKFLMGWLKLNNWGV